MIWIAIGLYFAILTAAIAISAKPVRIPAWITPGSLGAPMESLRFPSEDGVPLHAWHVERESPTAVFIVSHGFYLNRAEMIPEAFLLWKQGAALIVLDERCHGRSGGKITTIGWMERLDVIAAIRQAKSLYPESPVVLYGSSMGAAASAFAAGEHPDLVDGLILDSAYGRFSSAILGWWNFVGGKWLQRFLWPTVWLAGLVLKLNPFRIDVAQSLSLIKDTPVLFLHGTADKVAAPSEVQRNLAACSGPTEIVWFPNRNHSEGRWEDAPMYHESLLKFCIKWGWITENLESR